MAADRHLLTSSDEDSCARSAPAVEDRQGKDGKRDKIKGQGTGSRHASRTLDSSVPLATLVSAFGVVATANPKLPTALACALLITFEFGLCYALLKAPRRG
ncbi:MAG: hypothetical protein ACPG4T_23995, partial [Nannocystaceae bacterium]